MGEYVWFHEIQRTIPDFDLGRCRWLLRIDIWTDAGKQLVRLVLQYADLYVISLIAHRVRELPRRLVSEESGGLVYSPYDLGEFLIGELPELNHVVLYDELKGWTIIADAVSLESVAPLERDRTN